MPSARISGLAIAEGIAGFVLLWSGLKNLTLQQTITDLARGKVPEETSPEAAPVLGVTDAATTAATSGSGGSVTAPGSASAPGAVNGCSAAQTSSNKALGKVLASARGWGSGGQWDALNGVVMLESGWCNTAQNPGSTAYGIGQFLDTTWSTVGYSKTSSPAVQIAAMLAYIKKRYGTPEAAYSFHIANGYY